MSPFPHRSLVVVPAAFLLLLAVACGADDTSSATLADGDQVDIEMANLAFDPSEFTLATGATVTFVFDNTDSIDHEALIGDEAAQDDHESEMTSGGGMGDGGSDHDGTGGSDTTETTDGGMGGMKAAASGPSEAVTVAPGETAELTYTFEEPGTVLIGCHQPGHYGGGMKATITVT